MFQERTLYDLLTEFYVDYFEKNPLEVHRNADGHVQFKNTGDPLIDKWEEQIARGESPDFGEAFSPEQREKLERMRERGRARTRVGGSFKSIMESMEREALRQGILPGMSSRQGPATISRTTGRPMTRSNFGDGKS